MYKKQSSKDQIEQGDIYDQFVYVKWAEEINDEIKLNEIKIPYFVVLTQICDLEHDFRDRFEKSPDDKRDKYIQSILVCPAFESRSLKEGNHLEEHGFKCEYQNRDRWNIITNNKNERYHYLEKDDKKNIPSLVLDFKHYYTIPADVFYGCFNKHYVASLQPLYREQVTQRFANFLARIGLPAVQ